MNYSKIPSTDSIKELAQFWDTHDLIDFEDQLEEVKDQVFERETLISLRLELHEVETIKKIAKSQGVDYHNLIREWVLEKVSQF
ncbi:CopG family antitoxin [Aphanothece sacrum]|uniref:CopG antitoxin of type II toxin-antitoxin system n=1 Tax=Aphanothece sacrum FPU1 TaxID=1920663 RepID=A0A401IJ68_APHSA|nr:CopG family antitoxin [Aphanothece sacrum]GBF81352.1 hypothetical protein AsFPU1_2765 [Aphanothece sacrum FPU1]GBF86126.1 hypothetical protein AsFPU3_3196 [Aphanothece sacrum FPU3]